MIGGITLSVAIEAAIELSYKVLCIVIVVTIIATINMLVGIGIFVQEAASSEIIWLGLPKSRGSGSVKDNRKLIVIVMSYKSG